MKPKTTTFAFVVSVTVEKPIKASEARQLLRDQLPEGVLWWWEDERRAPSPIITKVTITPVKES